MLLLSWDLFIIVVFAVIIAYSFIIGRENTLKVIIGSYISILAADGLGNLFKEYALSSHQFLTILKILGLDGEDSTMVLFKVVIFIAAIVIISVKGGFEIEHGFMRSGMPGVIMTLLFGFMSAGLVISTLLIYVSGASFVAGDVTITNNALASAYSESDLVKMMIDNYNVWFALPAVSFVLASLLSSKGREDA